MAKTKQTEFDEIQKIKDKRFEQWAAGGLFDAYLSKESDLRAQWAAMPPEQIEWAYGIASEIEKPVPLLNPPSVWQKMVGNPKKGEISRQKKAVKRAEEIKLEKADLAAFILAPTETILGGPMHKKATRREIHKEAFLDKDERRIKEAGELFGYLVGGAVALAVFKHAVPHSFPSSVGALMSATKEMTTYASLAFAGGLGAKAVAEGSWKKVKLVLFETEALQRLANDPPLAIKKGPRIMPDGLEGDQLRNQSIRFESLCRKTPPADRVVLMQLNEDGSLAGLEALTSWRQAAVAQGACSMPETLSAALKLAKKIDKKNDSPLPIQEAEWLNPEFRRLRALLENKESHRGPSEMGLEAWGNWWAVKLLVEKNRTATLINHLPVAVQKVETAGDWALKMAKLRTNKKSEAELGKTFVRPPRATT